ncbi:MAG: redoxin domain-containing protein [Saprospiraceae bacterium]|nr:redoxin domain-containing protein [Saprospiraceae bacterium]
MPLNIGDKAPVFTLKDSDKNDVSLSDFQNKNVVILFFPFAFSGVCEAELCSIRDDSNRYNDLNAQVMAISVDSPFALAKFKSENQLQFPVLSDFNKTVCRAYDAIYEDTPLGLRGVAKRSAFVIDREGIVKYAEVLENALNLPNFEAVKQALSNLQ